MKAYLDSGATTVVSMAAVEAMRDVYLHTFGNPSSMHKMGVEAEKLLKKAKRILAKLIKATPDEIYFTSGGTEANNLAIRGYLSHSKCRKKQIITSVIEHPSVLNVYKTLEEEGYEVVYLPVDEKGYVDLVDLTAALSEETAMVSIMYVNNEIGTIQPLTKISKIIKQHSSAVFHVDAIQALGKVECHVKKQGVDIMTFSSHKIHGPMGVGALYIKKGTHIKPLMVGGSQEKTIRPGTENLPGIVGFSVACEEALVEFNQNQEHLYNIKNYFLKKVLEIPLTSLNGSETDAPHIVNVSFPKMRGEVLLHVLESHDIYVSTGSACASKNKSYSHVLEAIGLDNAHKEGAIRFSFSKYTTKDIIDYAFRVLEESIKDLDQIIKGR